MFETGIAACDQLKEVNISGNIIPQIWYKRFVKTELQHEKPHLLAINILADIVYWYRPTEVRDEATGEIIGYKKKFNSDLLQRTYKQITEMFGCSSGQAKEAIVFLEKMKVVKRVFRSLDWNGVLCSNILFIDLDVNRLRELTFPAEDKSSTGVGRNLDRGGSEFPQREPENPVERGAKLQQTNTESSSKISTETSLSIPQDQAMKKEQKAAQSSDRLSDEELKDVVEEEIEENKVIPYTYKSDKRKMQFALKYFTSYDTLDKAADKPDSEKHALRLLLECLVEMACADTPQTYSGSLVSYSMVIDRLNECIQRDRWLEHYVDETIDDYIKAGKQKEIKNNKNYMKSVIWNSFSTYAVKFDAGFARMCLTS